MIGLTIGTVTFVSVGVALLTLGSTYMTTTWESNVRDVLRILLHEFGLGRGLELTDRRESRISELLAEHEPPFAESVHVTLSRRLQGLPSSPADRERVERHAAALEFRSLVRLVERGRRQASVDVVLRRWRLWVFTERCGHVVVGVRRTMPRALSRAGDRAARVIGLAVAVVTILTIVVWTFVRTEGSWVDAVGRWSAIGAVAGVLVFVALEIRDHAVPELRARGVSWRRAAAVVGLAVLLVGVAQWSYRSGAVGELDERLVRALPEPRDLGPWPGAIMVVAFFAWAAFRAIGRTRNTNLSPSARIASAGGAALLVVLGVSVVLVLSVRHGAPVAWLGSLLVVVAPLAAGAWLVAWWIEHRRRVRALRAAGVTVSCGSFRWWAAALAVAAFVSLEPLLAVTDRIAPHGVVLSTSSVLAVALSTALALQVVLAAGLGSMILLPWQVAAGVGHVRRTRRAHEQLIRAHGRRARDTDVERGTDDRRRSGVTSGTTTGSDVGVGTSPRGRDSASAGSSGSDSGPGQGGGSGGRQTSASAGADAPDDTLEPPGRRAEVTRR